MKIQITFCVIVMYIWTSVDSQRICENKCYEYSLIPSNSSNHSPHMAVWSTVVQIGSATWEVGRYVILISEKFLLGTEILTYDELVSYGPSGNKVYFTLSDSHNVTKILFHPLCEHTESNAFINHKIILLKIDRITLDSHHRAACLWARNDFFPNTVQLLTRTMIGRTDNLTLNYEGLFDMELITKSGSFKTRDFCVRLTEFQYDFTFFPAMIQVPKPFDYLPTNYYVFGVGSILKTDDSTIYNVPMSSNMDWIESQVWETDDTSCGMATIKCSIR